MNKVKKPAKSKEVPKERKGKQVKTAGKVAKPSTTKAQKISVKGLKGLKEQKAKDLGAEAKKTNKKAMSKVVASTESSTEHMDEKVTALSQKWSSLYKKSQNMDVSSYDMKKTFEPKTAIEHKTLGWGYILENRNDRLEVLFKDGIRFLISNYKG